MTIWEVACDLIQGTCCLHTGMIHSHDQDTGTINLRQLWWIMSVHKNWRSSHESGRFTSIWGVIHDWIEGEYYLHAGVIDSEVYRQEHNQFSIIMAWHTFTDRWKSAHEKSQVTGPGRPKVTLHHLHQGPLEIYAHSKYRHISQINTDHSYRSKHIFCKWQSQTQVTDQRTHTSHKWHAPAGPGIIIKSVSSRNIRQRLNAPTYDDSRVLRLLWSFLIPG